jgi:WhiB family redox-sensing transcriptional regulator
MAGYLEDKLPSNYSWEWRKDSACRTGSPKVMAMFFHEGDTGKERKARERQAKEICWDCPVRAECLDVALATEEQFGILGGMTERERRDLLKKRRASASSSPTTVAA